MIGLPFAGVCQPDVLRVLSSNGKREREEEMHDGKQLEEKRIPSTGRMAGVKHIPRLMLPELVDTAYWKTMI